MLVTCIFFAKVVFLRQVPFPGDLLVDTSPFKTQSFLGFSPGGYPNKAQGRDVITQLYPWKYFSIQQLEHKKLPLWNPYNFSGNAHVANYQTGVFYPLNVLFLRLPFIPAWTIFIMLQPLLAVTFLYLFLRDLKLQQIPSLLGSVAFGFSSYMTVWFEWGNIDHTLLWLPLMLFAVRRLLMRREFGYSILVIIAGASSLLAGYIQGAFYVYILSIAYTIVLALSLKKHDIRFYMFVAATFLISVALAAVQILPTLAVFFTSTRGAYTNAQIQNLLQPLYYWITLFSSEFFGNPATRNYYLPITYFERVMYAGIPMLFFAIYALQKVKSLEKKFFGLTAGLVLVLTTNFPGISYLYQLPLPVISTTVPTRLLSIFIFSVVVLGSLGINYWLEKKEVKTILPILFAGIYVLVWFVLLLLPHFQSAWIPDIAISEHNFVVSTLLAFLTIAIFYIPVWFRRTNIIGGLLCVVVFADLFYIFTKFTPFVSAKLIYPSIPVIQYLQTHQGIYRNWGYGSGYIPANYATYFGIYSADGYDSLFSKAYGELLNSSATGKVQLPLSRTDANIAQASGFARLPDNQYRQKLLDLLGVKYIVHLPFSGDVEKAEIGVFPEDFYTFVWHDEKYQVYENTHVLPRYFLVSDYKLITQKNSIDMFYATDLRKTVLLYEKPSLSLNASASGTIILQHYAPKVVKFGVNTNGNTMLFLSDSYASGWQATIDGKATHLYKADVAFRAVEVPKGQHIIIFTYQPQEFSWGLAISLITFITGGSYLLVRRVK